MWSRKRSRSRPNWAWLGPCVGAREEGRARCLQSCLGTFDVNKMNIWHIYVCIWCPIIRFQMMQSLGEILTLVGGKKLLITLLHWAHTDPSWKINGCKFAPILYPIGVRFPKQVESIGGGLPVTKQSLLFINRLFLWMTWLRPSGPLSHLPTNKLGILESGAICNHFTHWFFSEMKVGAQISSENREEVFTSIRI